MWLAILSVAFALTIAGAVYLLSRFRRFGIVKLIAGERVWLQRLVAATPLLCFAAYGCFETVNTVIVVLHLAIFWLLADLVTGIAGLVIRRAGKSGKKADDAAKDAGEIDASGETKKALFRVYWKGIVVILLCTVYLGLGWYQAHNVSRTYYRIETDKELPGGKLRIVQIADSHIGSTFSGTELAKYMSRIEKEKPDIVVFTGDFVDDSTTREDMLAACRALGSIKAKVYFVYGNHDKGYYNSRGYTAKELDDALRAEGIVVMEDVVEALNGYYIVGRKDRNEGSRGDGAKARKSMEELTQTLDRNRFIIVLDHQPNDYEAEAAAGADLVLSGHTHGGQLIPLGPIGRWIGANDRTYGTETRGDTTFIVTSGISDWEIDFKTGTKSEYVVIDIEQK
jgi:Predicted phosphohydrolases